MSYTVRVGPRYEQDVTYNYSKRLYDVLDGGLRSLCGLRGSKARVKLDVALAQLKMETPTESRTECTDGNVRASLWRLRKACDECRNGLVRVVN